MSAVGIVERRDIAVVSSVPRTSSRGHVTHAAIIILTLAASRVGAQLGILPRLDRHLHLPIHPIAIDAWRSI